MVQVLVAGAGPAGWAAAAACARLGLDTALVAPAPHARWPATYGIWADQCALLPAGSRWFEAPARVFALPERTLARGYAVLDNASVQAALDCPNVDIWTTRVIKVVAGPRGCTVTLASGEVRAAALVIDATGARSPAGGAEQTAFGVVLPNQVLDGATVMDWRPAPGFDTSTFLYAVPLSEHRTLVEETSLAGRPGLGLAELRARLAARGFAPDGPVERVRIPLETPIPAARPGIVRFGAAGALVHPATGYSVADTFHLAPRLAEAIRAEVRRDPAAAGRRALWPPAARAVQVLRRRGLAVLLGLPPERLPEFFEIFFGLPAEAQRGYLHGREDVRGTAGAMAMIFERADRSLRSIIARLIFRP
jgi:lycopene beta-cyclase